MKTKVPKILIVYKKSSYQAHALDSKNATYLRLLRERSFVLRKSKYIHDTHLDTFGTVKSTLKKLRIPFDVKHRSQLKVVQGYDLVMTVGGDGTFLETSHYLDDCPLMGINSVPHDSVGYYCRSNSETFLEKLYQFIEGKAPIKKLQRLTWSVDGKVRVPLALNDILLANCHPAGTTRYILKVGSHQEEQKSSGLWISPAPGSTAATKSAGGKKLPLTSEKIQLVVREPYAPPGKKYSLLKKVLDPKMKVEICSTMDDAYLYIDGPHVTMPLKRGSRVVIQNAHRPVYAIW